MKRVAQVAGFAALTIATVVSLRYAVYLPFVCEARVTRALDAIDAAAERGETARRTASQFALSLVRGCGCIERLDFKLAYVRGTADRDRGDAPAAIDAYQRALSLDRRPEIYIDLGRAQLDAIDRAGAIDSFVAAGAFAPKLLDRIPYSDVRSEAERRIRERYGANWIE
jgi:tetratricopeptide (TPR) repeat protein